MRCGPPRDATACERARASAASAASGGRHAAEAPRLARSNPRSSGQRPRRTDDAAWRPQGSAGSAPLRAQAGAVVASARTPPRSLPAECARSAQPSRQRGSRRAGLRSPAMSRIAFARSCQPHHQPGLMSAVASTAKQLDAASGRRAAPPRQESLPERPQTREYTGNSSATRSAAGADFVRDANREARQRGRRPPTRVDVRVCEARQGEREPEQPLVLAEAIRRRRSPGRGNARTGARPRPRQARWQRTLRRGAASRRRGVHAQG